jgi:hypothetical protein
MTTVTETRYPGTEPALYLVIAVTNNADPKLELPSRRATA